MNFNVTNVIMFMAGSLLVYSGIKGVIPKDVILSAFNGGKPAVPNAAPAPAVPNTDQTKTPIYPSV